ncbi:MAG: hypothetical protein PVJ63_08850 [Thioalkalispiraceae bacterium]|jgi:hypothetical protein
MKQEPGVDIPAWVNWLAQDEDGTWWGYSVEPLQHHRGWYENEVGDVIRLHQDKPSPYWQKSLKRVSK